MKNGHGCLKGCLIAIVTQIVLIGGLIFWATIQFRRSDADILKNYKPTAEIADIAEKNTLTDKGKATLYRSEPEIVDGETFKKYCFANGVEALACNAPKPGGGPFGGRQIFLLKIDDPRFLDHKYAAAVHEMLHSAYNRLSTDEKKRLNTLLDQELAKRRDDSSLMGPIDTIKKRKSNNYLKDIQEELHSKFGVEYSDLSPELEDYYKQYFVDRRKVVELFKNGGFNSRVKKVEEISYETKMLASQLTAGRSKLTADQYNNLVYRYNAKAAESQRIYNEIKAFYQYFNPDYKPLENKIK